MKTRFFAGASLLGLLSLLAAPASAHEVGHHHDNGVQSVEPASAGITDLLTAFRRTGDDRYLDTAWARLEPVIAAGAASPDRLLDAALVAQARHDFEYALELTRLALAQVPGSDQGWLLLASIHLVRGEAEAAADACRQLRNQEPLVTITCSARVALARNETDRARQRLGAVLDVIDADAVSAEVLAWSLSVAGDLSATTFPDDAISYYRRSLQIAERTQVRAALTDVLLGEDRLAEAREAVDAGAAALPLVVRRLVIARRMGMLDSVAETVELTDRRFRGWIAARDWLHAREMARFYLDVMPRPELARQLADINLSLQREPEDLRLARRTGASPDRA